MVKADEVHNVQSRMKPACLWLLSWLAIAAVGAPQIRKGLTRAPATEHTRNGDDSMVVRIATANLAGAVNDLRSVRHQGASHCGQSAGNVWIEVNRLKREGQNVKAIEGYALELEHSFRSNPQNSINRRHILNNLDYEIEALKRRQR